MDIEIAAVLVPYVSAAIGRYGGGVLPPTQDGGWEPASDSAAAVGRRLLHRILSGDGCAEVRLAVEELAADPADDERVSLLRRRLRAAVAADPVLARAVAEILSAAGVTVPADHSAVVRTVSDVQSGEWPVIRPA